MEKNIQGKKIKDAGHQVFISYSREEGESTISQHDRDIANRVCAALESESIRCWIAPRDIVPGDDWLNEIINAVEKSKVLVLIFSSDTDKSQWINDEVKIALDKKIKIIPFRIEDISPQGVLRVLKVRCQWLDAYEPPLEKHIDRLVEAVCTHL